MKYILEVKEVLFLNLLEFAMKRETLAFLVGSYCVLPTDTRRAIVDDLFTAGVKPDWIEDSIHFFYNPVPGDRPKVMTAIGRGVEQLTAFSRVDESSIVLGFNGQEIDYPDLCDVYIESAQCRYTGEELSEEQLDELSDDHELKMSRLF